MLSNHKTYVVFHVYKLTVVICSKVANVLHLVSVTLVVCLHFLVTKIPQHEFMKFDGDVFLKVSPLGLFMANFIHFNLLSFAVIW